MSDVGDPAGAGAPPSSTRGSRLVATGILLSRLSGLVRERVFGAFFGTSDTAGAFKTAFRIPNLLQNLLGEGVLSASFIPVYARLLEEGREEEAGRVAGAVAGFLVLAVAVVVVALVVLADPIVWLFTLGGFEEDGIQDLTVRLLRIIAPGIGVLVLSAWCLGVLNSHRRFFLSYVAPVLWNLAQVVVLLFAAFVAIGTDALGAADSPARVDLVTALAWATVLGALLQLGVQLPAVRQLAPDLRPSLDRSLEGVRRTFRAFGPVVAGRGVVQLGNVLDLALAGLLAASGSAIAALAAAQTLYVLPVSLFGMSVAAAELPELSRAGTDDLAALRTRLVAGSRRIAFYVVPTVLVFLLAGDLVVGMLYRQGAFQRLEELQVALVLAAFATGLLAATASRLLQSVFYGTGDVRTPAVIAAVRVLAGTVVALAVMFALDQLAITESGIGRVGSVVGPAKRLGAVGIAMGGAAAAWTEFLLLRRRLRDVLRDPLPLGGGLLPELAVPVLAAAIALLAARWATTGLHPLAAGPLVLGVAGGTYLVVAARRRVPEARALFTALAVRLDR